MWALYMTLGAWGLKAIQVCRRGMIEMDAHDSWGSIMELERKEGR
jgi:hypothetical protein